MLVDTNILVYAYDLSEPKKRQRALKILKECWEGKTTLAISAQNLSEFYVIATQKIQNSLKKEEVKEIIEDIITSKNWKVLNINKEHLLDAINLSIKHKTSYWDSLIVATMLSNKIFNIYTEDAFDNFSEIKSFNPC